MTARILFCFNQSIRADSRSAFRDTVGTLSNICNPSSPIAGILVRPAALALMCKQETSKVGLLRIEQSLVITVGTVPLRNLGSTFSEASENFTTESSLSSSSLLYKDWSASGNDERRNVSKQSYLWNVVLLCFQRAGISYALNRRSKSRDCSTSRFEFLCFLLPNVASRSLAWWNGCASHIPQYLVNISWSLLRNWRTSYEGWSFGATLIGFSGSEEAERPRNRSSLLLYFWILVIFCFWFASLVIEVTYSAPSVFLASNRLRAPSLQYLSPPNFCSVWVTRG